ncbi:ABC transporter substrate-binding protein [Pleomorphovibrio marinus]|uniref:ABC transporter substrate-binding protein n=1 Tax=Pleomorphovibrio marinus TaxID=2164132 RepID=UPI000E0A66DA|nr:ABC transporter substrate-binding protein [Pleomorphovibrio marinus]
MYRTYLFVISLPFFLLFSCQEEKKLSESGAWIATKVEFADGFTIKKKGNLTLIEVHRAFAKEHAPFTYLVLEGHTEVPDALEVDAIIHFPIKKIVLTSTSQVPHLDMLGVPELLAGFPNLDLVSTASIRERIEEGKIQELGKGPLPNAELLLDLEPDWVMVSSLGDDPKLVELCQRAGVPAVLNGEYLERHPLGRAEWIKLTGALTGQEAKADSVFNTIKEEYQRALRAVAEEKQLQRPSVLSGVMYQDIWYAPGGDSWAADLLEKAGGDYLFKDQKRKGSTELSYEFVLDRALEADFWIGAADHVSLEEMEKSNHRYAAFKAFKKRKVYTYTAKKGETGGLMYFEEGYMRPDLVLKDLIKIFHPHLLPEHSLYFYTAL